MKKHLLFLVIFIAYITSYAQEYSSPEVYNTLSQKNFYLLNAIQNDNVIKEILIKDDILSEIFKDQKDAISKVLKEDSKNLDSLISPYIFSTKSAKKITENLYRIFQDSKKFRNFINADIRNSGAYILYNDLEDQEFIQKIWNLNAEGINHILNTYGKGKLPQYASIDSVSYDVTSDYYKGAVKMWSKHIYSETKEKQTWFSPSLNLALSLLYLNHRDEAARYEPLEKLENKKTVENIKNIDFEAFPYASILILGNGPENYRDRLSALGKLNIKLGVKEYLDGKAPIIVVSGGHAHPFRAEYCEAIEMKKELITEYHIPEDHIIIEPHARHTTTNLRNTARLYIQYNIPMSKAHLVVTNNGHSQYVSSNNFLDRCVKELGYLPAKIKSRINNTAVEFVPLKTSLQQNPLEPLDP
ncbi:YdcF family protein [Zunongwangia sp. HGR-M22]|uniref:YdcF family protein n=1 Tax=Zunongwangia sp. HGR-M22 TaxID=3015168 RepID=UPI0022DD21DA|nr:YdcF family protein [Zunongwangia sp. HGR-M22]WBL24328.1 YdcF family protein [Zunongwangia sp. HGR-M22]